MNNNFYIKYLKYKSKYQSMKNTIYMEGGCNILNILQYSFQLKTKTGIVKYTVKLVNKNKINIFINTIELESYKFDFDVNLLVGIQIAIIILNKVYGLKTISSGNGKKYELSTTNHKNKYNIFDIKLFLKIYSDIFLCDIETIINNTNFKDINNILQIISNNYNKDKTYFENISHPETNPSASEHSRPSTEPSESPKPPPKSPKPPPKPSESPSESPKLSAAEPSKPPKLLTSKPSSESPKLSAAEPLKPPKLLTSKPSSESSSESPKPSESPSESPKLSAAEPPPKLLTSKPSSESPKLSAAEPLKPPKKSDETFDNENTPTVKKPNELIDISFFVF